MMSPATSPMTISLEEHVARAIAAAELQWKAESGGDDASIVDCPDDVKARAAIAAVREREGAERGHCCDNGRFGETHECQKQPAPDPAEAMRARIAKELVSTREDEPRSPRAS